MVGRRRIERFRFYERSGFYGMRPAAIALLILIFDLGPECLTASTVEKSPHTAPPLLTISVRSSAAWLIPEADLTGFQSGKWSSFDKLETLEAKIGPNVDVEVMLRYRQMMSRVSFQNGWYDYAAVDNVGFRSFAFDIGARPGWEPIYFYVGYHRVGVDFGAWHGEYLHSYTVHDAVWGLMILAGKGGARFGMEVSADFGFRLFQHLYDAENAVEHDLSMSSRLQTSIKLDPWPCQVLVGYQFQAASFPIRTYPTPGSWFHEKAHEDLSHFLHGPSLGLRFFIH